MNILDKIVKTKLNELKKKEVSLQELIHQCEDGRVPLSLKKALLEKPGVIAEFKRKSPSKSWINQSADITEITRGYELGGASAISVLTDQDYFGGSLQDLEKARQAVAIPLLRKEFIIDPYQVYEAKVYGADLILLIARILTDEQIYDLSKLAKSLGLEVLLEVHHEQELLGIEFDYIDLVGVNNRNLDTFVTDIETSARLFAKLPSDVVKISESGIFDIEVVKRLIDVGYRGFLIGENFMRTEDPSQSCRDFINQL